MAMLRLHLPKCDATYFNKQVQYVACTFTVQV